MINKSYSEKEKHKIEETVSHWISSSIYYPSPVGLVTVYTDTDILTIEVNPGENQPYSLDEKIYVRNNSESVKASAERVNKMLANQKLDTFDKTKSLNQNLSFRFLKETFNEQDISFKPQALGFHTNVSKSFTNTAFLMSDQNTFLVKIAVFNGLTVEQFKDRKEISGSLIKQIDDTLEFIKLNNPLSSIITGKGQRTDKQSYPEIAIREAVVNALSHRSYFSKSPVQIEIFDDRLTIMSPGPLPGGLRTEAVLSGQTLPRNPNIVSLLHRLKYIENYGTGLRRIFTSYQNADKQPQLDAQEDFVKVNLPNLNYTNSKSIPNNQTIPNDPNSSLLLVTEYLEDHEYITRSKVETLLELKSSQARKSLKLLVTSGVLKKIGAGPSTKYMLND